MKQVISLLMPTRQRVNLAKRFLESVLRNSIFPDALEIILYVDDDDLESHNIQQEGLKVTTLIGPRKTMGSYNSECLSASIGEIIVLVNDDMVIQTHGWDEKIRELDNHITDKIYLAYGNDLFKKNHLCTFPILSRHTCDTLIEPYHRAYRGAFIDYHLMDIFKRLEKAGIERIFYLNDVVFEHFHYRTGKAEIDETYTKRGRFDDDMIFVALSSVRRASLPLLENAIQPNKPAVHALPEYQPIDKPKNLWQASTFFTRIFLFDTSLPFRWRFFLWWWFGARYVAAWFLKLR